MITIEGQHAVARFSQFDLADYATFLKLKRTVPAPEMDLKYDWRSDSYTVKMPSRYAAALGCDGEALHAAAALPLAPYLFDYQRWFMQQALERKRYALFWDCGLGKTLMALEFSRQAMALTGKRAMICTFNLIIGEFLEQAKRFYGKGLKIEVLETRKDIRLWAAEDLTAKVAKNAKEFDCDCPCDLCAIGTGMHCGQPPCDVQQPKPRLGIMNTEKFMDKKEGLIPELRQLGCFALDESSILKTGGGTAKWNIIKSTKGIKYKLSGSATPAPNEAMEYASQASFLETITNDGEIIWTFFTKDKQGEWYIKPHALQAFYRFLSGWSNYMRTPAAYGFKDNVKPVPEPEFIVHQVQATPEQMAEAQRYRFQIGAGLIGDQRLGVKERMKLSQIAKGFVYANREARPASSIYSKTNGSEVTKADSPSMYLSAPLSNTVAPSTGKRSRPLLGKKSTTNIVDAGIQELYPVIGHFESMKPGKVAELAAVEVVCNGCQVLVWTVFDEETNLIMQAFSGGHEGVEPPFVVRALTGKTRDEDRESILWDFKRGEIDVLVSNARMLGFGQNLQMAGAMIISGWNDSFEQLYQLIRRSVRYGQTKVVRIHIPIVPELEQAQWDNLQRKQKQFDEQAAMQERFYREAMRERTIG